MPEIIYAESNGHLADDVVRTYDITVVSNWWHIMKHTYDGVIYLQMYLNCHLQVVHYQSVYYAINHKTCHCRKLSSVPGYIVQCEHMSTFFRHSSSSSLNASLSPSSLVSSTVVCQSSPPVSAKLSGKCYLAFQACVFSIGYKWGKNSTLAVTKRFTWRCGETRV